MNAPFFVKIGKRIFNLNHISSVYLSDSLVYVYFDGDNDEILLSREDSAHFWNYLCGLTIGTDGKPRID